MVTSRSVLHWLCSALIGSTLLAISSTGAAAQTVELRQWQGAVAVTHQPEQIVAGTLAEWRSLWSRVGLPAPDLFEAGRMNAVGIFLGARSGDGYSVNILSASRRRERIVVVFEERMPPSPAGGDTMMASRPSQRSISSNSFAPAATAAGSPPPAMASRTPILGPPTSPWAIVLINRADMPVSVEQRLFR
jgi:hypothetical protein